MTISDPDEWQAEFQTRKDIAWQRCFHGKTFSPAFEIAWRIKLIRFILSKKEEENADPDLNEAERKLVMQTAGILIMCAITESKKLREIADALDAKERADPRRVNILTAYEDCVQGRYPPTVVEVGDCFVTCRLPTLAQLRDAFIIRFGEQCWPPDFSVRKTLRILGLPLTKSKRGARPNSR